MKPRTSAPMKTDRVRAIVREELNALMGEIQQRIIEAIKDAQLRGGWPSGSTRPGGGKG